MTRARLLLAAALVPCAAGVGLASSPILAGVQPNGGPRGAQVELQLSGARLADAVELLWYDSTIATTSVEPASGELVKAVVQIPPDCRLGEHALRLRTKTGVTELRTFYVGALPDAAEVEPNNDFEAPQAVPLNCTISGVVESEDVDYYVVEAKKGQRITAEIEAVRLGMTLFDPFVAILDEKRFELAGSDDSSLLLQDSIASIVAPEDGKYIVQVRESSYGGNGNCRYRLHLGTFPRPTVVYPAGGRPGETLSVRFLGDAGGPIEASLALPQALSDKFAVFAEQNGEVSPSPNFLRVVDLVNVLEAEPNNAFAEATPSPEAPAALNGIVEADGDVDYFKVPCRKGQTFDVQVYARRLRSPLDPVLTIHSADGKLIASNDDSGGPDGYLRFEAPEDGEYLVGLADHLGKGGSEYVYRIEFQPVAASLQLTIPPVARASQDRWAMAVPRGNRFATLMVANRANFGGGVGLSAENLPPGVSMLAEPIPENMSVGPVVFEAAADAPDGAALVELTGRHVDPNVDVRGRYRQQIDLVIAPPNQTVYYSTFVDKLAVCVTDEVPFKIDVVPPKAPLVQNGAMDLRVVATRRDGYTKPITLYFPFAPPGVGAASSVAIPEGANEAVYPLNANGNAQIGNWKVVVIGSAEVGDGPVWVSTQLANLTIAPPYAKVALELAAAEQGAKTEVVAKIEHTTPFEGPAKIQLVGLPAGVVAEPLEFTKDSTELAFPVTIDAASPAGQHKSLFVQFTLTAEGEPVVHSSAFGGVLRIDPPPPPTADAPAPTTTPEPQSDQPPPKRLSRLEKLRLEQAERQRRLAESADQKTEPSSQ